MHPVRGPQVTEEWIDNKTVRLTYPLTVKPWFAKFAGSLGLWDERARDKTIELDELGSFTWRRINGERSVHDIAKEFETVYQVHSREAETAVAQFIQTLGRRGIVGLR